ncbi:MAG TPA: hypothetical protein VMM60_10555 [Ilumatobacter sp.]|nr:hypothetical protein [Ilumatobacter sp.]
MSTPNDPKSPFDAEDQRLANDLRAAASNVSARADIGEVEAGAARVRSRRRAATGIAAAAIVAAAGGAGFGLGRAASVSNDNTSAMEAPEAPATTDPATTDPATTDPATPAPATTTVELTAPAATLPEAPIDDSASATTMVPSGDVPASASDMTSSYYPGMPAQYEFVSERTDESGLRIRVLRGPTWGMGDYYPGAGWSPAEFCWATGDLRVTFDSPTLVDVTSFSYFTQLFDGVEAQVSTAGWADGQTMRVGMVQTDTDATDVVITWEDGITAAAPVVDGVAVVASPGPESDPNIVWALAYTIELVGPSGMTSVSSDEFDRYSDPVYREACEPPPPALPDAGEQPTDPDAGQALADRFAELWSRDVPFADKPHDLLDDWTGVVTAAELVNSGTYAEAASTAEHVIDEFVFTSPTEAWLRYTIYTDMGTFAQRYATATLVDGLWQFPRAAVCQDLSLAGGGCEPFVEQIYPPSWYQQNGAVCGPVEPSGDVVCNEGDTSFDM